MRTHLDCIPCIVRQSLDSARFATPDEKIQERIVRETLQRVCELDWCQSPPAIAQQTHRRIRELTRQDDPYRLAKQEQNAIAAEYCDSFRRQIQQSDRPLELAVRLAIAGNVIDLGVKTQLDVSQIRAEIEGALSAPLDGDVGRFANAVGAADQILYLTDNAGEIVFDRLLIEQLPPGKTTVAVRGAPIINDATLADATFAGITDLVPVIDNGSDAPGTILEECSEAFRQRYAAADLIIAKGQGNYETLQDAPGPLYFLLRVKCQVIARDLGSPIGRMVLSPAEKRTVAPR